MSQDHYLPLFVGDFLASTATWTGPERGLYLQLLAFQWTSGPLPCDQDRLALVLHYDPKEFRKLWPVMAGKFKNGDGALRNPRLEAVREKNAEIQVARSEAGRRGGLASSQARSNQTPKQTPSNGEANASGLVGVEYKQTQSKNEPSDPIRSDPIRSEKNSTARKRASVGEPEGFAEFRQVFPPRAGSQPWSKARGAWNARVGEGIPPAELIIAAKRYASFIDATGQARTRTVLQAATFLGPDEHYKNPFDAPAAKEKPRWS